MYGFQSIRESVFALWDPVNLKISIIGKYTASGFPFYQKPESICILMSILKILTVSLDIIFTCIQIWYDMAARTHDFFANLGHFQGIIICLYDNKRQ